MKIADLLKIYRKENNLSQSALGSEIGLPQDIISRLENNIGELSMRSFIKILLWLMS